METEQRYVILKQGDWVLHLESGDIGIILCIETNKSNPDNWNYEVGFPRNLDKAYPNLFPQPLKRKEIQKVSWICEQDFVDKTK